MKRITALLLAAVMTVSCAACSGGAPEGGVTESGNESSGSEAGSEEAGKEEGDIVQIGFVCTEASHPWVADTLKGEAKAEIDLAGKAKITLLDAQSDVATQVSQVEQLINQKVDCIVLHPLNATALVPAVEAANEAGIPVICANSKVDGGEYVYVGSEDYDAGYLQGKWVAENAPENCRYLYMYCLMGQTAQIEREKGFQDAIAESGRTDLELVAAQTANGYRDEAMKLMEDWIQAYPNGFDLIVSQAETMTLGAVEAMMSAGVKDVINTAVDISLEGVDFLRSGEISMCVFQDGRAQFYQACMAAYETAIGEYDGQDKIIPFQIVTKDNCDIFEEYFAAEEYDPHIFDGMESNEVGE